MMGTVLNPTTAEKKDKRAALEEKYAAMGIEIESNWSDEPKVYSVRLDLTPKQWMGLLNTEGEYLPMCCADISHIRDVLFDVIRDDFQIRVDELHEIVLLYEGHNGSCGKLPNDDPLKKMKNLWEKIKDDAGCSNTPFTLNPSSLQDAIHTVSRGTNLLSWDSIHHKDKDQKFTSEALKREQFYKLVPAIKTLHDELLKLKLKPLIGYAVFCSCKDKGKPIDEVIELRSGGNAIFKTQKQAQSLSDHMNKHAEDSPRYTEQVYYVQKCRVSIEKGLEKV